MNVSDLAEDYLVDPKEAMRKLTTGYLNEVMRLEAEKQIQARPYERTGKRRAHRNGTRPRLLKTIHGEIELDKPQIREFSFKTKVFERYSRVEESVRVAVAESYLEGVSASVTSGPKVHNPGGLKVHTSTSLASNPKGCGDVAGRRVPHVKRPLQTGIEHQRDCPSNGIQSQDRKQIRES